MDEERQESLIKCIFLCKFDPEVGPVIVCQYPENYITKEVFEAVQNYLISKLPIKKRTITVCVFGQKISGYPNEIKNDKYLRNALIFNLCFVCDSKSRSVHYEPVVKKMSEYLENLELENGFLSSEECEEKLPGILAEILNKLNERGECTIKLALRNHPLNERRMSKSEKKTEIDYGKSHGCKERRMNVYNDRKNAEHPSNLSKKTCESENISKQDLSSGDLLPYISVLNLKQDVGMRPDPIQVYDHHVPVIVCEIKEGISWDLTTQQILRYIDGSSHIAKIAATADVDIKYVKACVQNLAYYGIVKLLPIFLYSNMYVTLPGFHKLYASKEIQEECLKSVAIENGQSHIAPNVADAHSQKSPTLADVMQLYSSFTYGVTVRDLCLRFKPQMLHIDERKLIQFGLLHGFMRRIHHYPFLTTVRRSEEPLPPTLFEPLFKLCNGVHCIDEICCKLRMTYREVSDNLEKEPNIVMIMK